MKHIIIIVSLVFSFVFFVVPVSAGTISNGDQDGVTDDYTGYIPADSSGSISNLGAGRIIYTVPRIVTNVPFSLDSITDSSGIDIGIGAGGGSVNVPITFSDAYTHYSGSIDRTFSIRLSFPNVVRGTYVTGNVSIPLYFVSHNSSSPVTFYQSDGMAWQYTSRQLTDYTKRYDLSLKTVSTDSMRCFLVNESSNNIYRLNIEFNDFLVPTGGDYASKISIDLNYHFDFSLTTAVTSFDSHDNYYCLISAVLLDIDPNNIAGLDANGFLNSPSFTYSNDYYTVFNAVKDGLNADWIANGVDYSSIIAQILSVLNQMKQADYDFRYVNFTAFSNSVLSFLGSMASDLSVLEDLSPIDYNNILNQINTKLQNIHGNVVNVRNLVTDVYNELVVIHNDIGDLNSWMAEIYQYISGYTFTYDVPDPDEGTISIEGYSQSIIGLIYAIASSFTGDNLLEGRDLNFDSLSSNTYDRWVDIISDALFRAFDGHVPAGSDALGLDIDSINLSESNLHLYEEGLWDRVYYVLDDGNFFATHSSAPASVVGTGDWFVAAINSIYGQLGIFTFVISTILLAGLFVVILGRIRQFN